MINAKQKAQDHIIMHEIVSSLVNGQYKQAKEQTLQGCRTNPERLAYRSGRVVWHVCTQLHNGGHLAEPYINSFR